MHIGTSTAFVLAFSLFGDLCGPKKPPEPPPPAPLSADHLEANRQNFARIHEMFAPNFKENLPKLELLEAEYQDQEKALNAKAREMSTYSVVVKQHDELVARTEALKAAHASWDAYFEEHKAMPDNDHQRKLSDDASKAQSEGNKLLVDYNMLNVKVRQIASEAR